MSEDNAGQPGSAAESNDAPTLYGMLYTFGTGAIAAGVFLAIFLVLRKSNRRFYAPRTYLGSIPEQERTPALPNGLFNWVKSFWKIPDVHALRHQTLDAYLFLRFLRMCTTICFVGLCMTWPILFPLNITGGGRSKELDKLSMSNIDTSSRSKRNRLYGHVLVGWLFYGFVLYMVFRECIFYINLRQAYLLAPHHARRISPRTVLFTCVPDTYLNEERLRAIFENSAKRIWVTRDTKELDDLVEERTKVAMQLEKAEVKLLKLCNQERLKAIKKGAPAEKTPPAQDPESGSIAARWIPDKKRPSHRLGPLGLVGKKVDTIEWCREELQGLTPRIETAQGNYKALEPKAIPAVFIEFHTQSDAQAAFQVLAHHQPLHMIPKLIGVRPEEVIWKNLRLPWWQRVVRRYVVIAFIAVLIIFWAVPVAFVATISQISYLTSRFSWLAWINDIPHVVLGLITGLLPSVALAILMSLVPIIITLCGRLSGEPTESRVELFTQNAYFAFQVVQVFLVTTLASGATTIAGQLGELKDLGSNPTKVFDVLSNALPKASNFYINFFIIQGLTIAVGVLAQVAGFVVFYLMYRFLANTPRALYQKWTTLAGISWGKVMPIYTNIAVISVTYAVIAPLMLFWATVGIGCFYLAYRYNILFVSETEIDTRGLIYPRAMKQLLTGVYLAEICMIGLTAVSKSPGPVVLMVVFFIFTILFHITMDSALNPLLYNLPRSLQVEEEALMQSAQGQGEVDGQEVTNTKSDKSIARGEETMVEAKGNFITKFLKPWQYASYMHLRKLVPHNHLDLDNLYEEHTELNSYHPPSVSDKAPLLWIPEDGAGVSKQEIALTSRVIPITDEGCTLDDKNKIVWDTEGARPPIWEEKTYY